MADLDVALRLRLINGLKAGSAEAKRDLAGIGSAAKRAGQKSGLDGLSRDLEAAIARARRLERQLAGLRNARGFGFGNIGASLDGAAAGAQRAARAAGRLAGALEKAQGPASSLRREYEGIAAAAERAARAGGSLRRGGGRGGVPGAGPPSRGGRTLDDDGSGAAAGLAGRAVLGPGAVGAVGAALTARQVAREAIKSFADLETAAKQLAITAGKTDEEVAKVVEQYRKLGPAMGVSAKEMVEAAQAFVAAGLDFDTAIAAVPSAVKAAKASFGEVGDTAKAGIAAINNLGIPVAQLSEAFDRMAKAGKEGNVELKDLARLLPEVAAAGSSIGLEGLSGLTDLIAALEIVGKVAATPSEAATKLKDLIGKATADETVRAFEKVGEAMGRVVKLEQEMEEGARRGESKLAVILRLTKELTQGNPFRLNELFGDKEAREAIAALIKFEADFNAIRERINTSSKGMIDADFANATARLAADFERMGAAWDRLMGRMGEAAAPGLSALTKEATGFLERMEQGDTILQRILKRLGWDRDEAFRKELEEGRLKIEDGKLKNADGSAVENALEKWFEENLPWLSGKKWNDKVDEGLGKTGREAEQLRERDDYRRRAEDDAARRRLPDELREQIARLERALEQARRAAEGPAGPQADIARGQVPKREADIARLKEELAKATAAVEAMEEARRQELAAIEELAGKLQAMERAGGFGLNGPKGKEGKVGPGAGAFGFGRYGTKDLPGGPSEPEEAAPEPEPAPKAEAVPAEPEKAKPRARAKAGETTKAEVEAEPQDLSAVGTQTIETYRQAVKAGLDKLVAEVTAAAAQMKAALSFTATPTITPRISAPSGGGSAAPGASPARATGPAPAGGAPTVRSASLRRGGGNTFNGPIHVHGVRDVASLQRGIQREADRTARASRNDALHDTGVDTA